MPLHVTCPACKHRKTVPDHFAGKKARCPKCKIEFEIRAPGNEAETAVVAGYRARPAPAEKPMPVKPAGPLQSRRLSPAPHKTPVWVWLVAGLGCAALVILMVVIRRGAEEKPPGMPKPPKPSEQAISITAVQLLNAYRDNGVAVKLDYEGKLLEVTGVARSISTTLGQPTVLLGGEERFEIIGVQCTFHRNAAAAVANLHQLDIVTIRGRCSGKTINILLRDCELR